MKAKLSLLSLAVCAAFGASSAFAQTGTITFQGLIQSANCTATVSSSGAGNGTVNLGQIAPTQLPSNNMPGPHTAFTVSLAADCAGASYWTHFSGPSGTNAGQVDPGTGRLGTNLANVSLELTDGTAATPLKFVAGVPTAADVSLLQGTAPGTDQGSSGIIGTDKTYGIRWFRGNGAPGAGALVGVTATYNMIYH